MLDFVNDYSEGCFPEILEKLSEINFKKISGYGEDRICKEAGDLIRELTGAADAGVYFLAGGTQTNQIVIDSLTGPYDGVISAVSGHVNVHEAGAIEFTGHKVLALPEKEGKINACDIDEYIKDYYDDESFEHMVRPGIVYISHPTEKGTLYSLKELKEIRKVCDKYNIPLFLDGARLSSALASSHTDVSLKDIAGLTDVFYMGGTKCGALYGEAVVFTKNNMPFRFNTIVKQHGAMLAKGWLLGLQFKTLLEGGKDDITKTLYYKGGAHANRAAEKVKQILKDKGYRLYADSPTNQIFIILENEKLNDLAEKVSYSRFEKYGKDHTIIRFATSWATKEEDLSALLELL